MEVQRICEKCGELNIINNNTIYKKDVWDEENNYFKVIYFKCSRCKTIHVVQIDDIETINLFKDLKHLIMKNAKKQMKHQTISPKDIKRKDKWMKELKEKRKDLEELNSGKKLFDENKNIFIEELTFNRVGDIIEE